MSTDQSQDKEKKTGLVEVTPSQGDGEASPVRRSDQTLTPQEDPQETPLSKALVPSTFEQLERFSQLVSKSEMVPKSFRGKPGDVMVAVMQGMEVGLKPLNALQNIAVINGKPSIYGDAAIALVRRSEACEWIKEWIELEGDDRVAYCETKRRGAPEPQTRTFSVEDAKKAGLWDKTGPWQDYPQRMLQMRARSWLLRDVYADVLQGLYIAEEAADIDRTSVEPAPDASRLMKRMEEVMGAKPAWFIEATCGIQPKKPSDLTTSQIESVLEALDLVEEVAREEGVRDVHSWLDWAEREGFDLNTKEGLQSSLDTARTDADVSEDDVPEDGATPKQEPFSKEEADEGKPPEEESQADEDATAKEGDTAEEELTFEERLVKTRSYLSRVMQKGELPKGFQKIREGAKKRNLTDEQKARLKRVTAPFSAVKHMRAALRGEVDQEKFNEVMDWFLGEIQSWPDQEEADEAYGIVHQEAQRLDKETPGFNLEVVDEEGKGADVGESDAVKAMEKGETALGDDEAKGNSPEKEEKQELPEHVLPSGFPAFGKLRAAGLDTPEAVDRKLKQGTLQEIEGIGPATEAKIKNTLEDMRKGESGLFGDG